MSYVKIMIFLLVLLQFSELSAQSTYTVIRSKADPSLSKSSAMVVINVNVCTKLIKQESVAVTIKGVTKNVKTNDAGNAGFKSKPGKFSLQFSYSALHEDIFINDFVLTGGYRTEIKLKFERTERGEEIQPAKPVIYLYSDKKQEVEIVLNVKGEMSFSYPAYEEGWNVECGPTGNIYKNDRVYPYLFWDAKQSIRLDTVKNMNTGFIVNTLELTTFFEEKLFKMGLKANEVADFITYWCPRLKENQANYIHFLFNEDYDVIAEANVTPKPDNRFRVFMLWSKYDPNKPVKIEEQKIESFQRNGFTYLEWGGAESNTSINDILNAFAANNGR